MQSTGWTTTVRTSALALLIAAQVAISGCKSRESLALETIDKQQAVAAAQEQAPDATAAFAKLVDADDPVRPVWEVVLVEGDEATAVEVDALTGEIVRVREREATKREKDEVAGRGVAPPKFKLPGSSFDDVESGHLPPGWKVEGTHQVGPLATWEVVTDSSAPSPPNVLALSRVEHGHDDVFNLCWTDEVAFQDGVLSVRFKAVSGVVDQGGGLVWRVRDADNYYICRANPLESNIRVYVVEGGRRRQLDTAIVDVKAGEWHRLTIEHDGAEIRCSFDGDQVLAAHDETFPGPGGVGLWTKADAVTSFDDLADATPLRQLGYIGGK